MVMEQIVLPGLQSMTINCKPKVNFTRDWQKYCPTLLWLHKLRLERRLWYSTRKQQDLSWHAGSTPYSLCYTVRNYFGSSVTELKKNKIFLSILTIIIARRERKENCLTSLYGFKENGCHSCLRRKLAKNQKNELCYRPLTKCDNACL